MKNEKAVILFYYCRV